MKIRPSLSAAALGIFLLAAGCKQNVADLPARDHSQDGAVTPASLPTTTAAARADPRDAPIPDFRGKPMWAANKSHTAQENAQYQFEKHGADFGVPSVEAYVSKAHDFTGHPPGGADRVTRSNGDTLIYDARDNIFAVVSKDGAPRTLFKPDDGPAYWAQQKEQASGKSASAARKTTRPRSSQG